MERRKTSHEVLEQERRIRDNRNNDSRWNIKNHHILVIALERNVGKPEPWKAGDNVLVLPKIKRSLKPKKNSAQNSSSNVLEKALEINCYI
jgi:serine/threonine-protein kinase RIO1